ncbi:MAG: hypothetical protein JNK45_08865 [Myxococcales bacterium]|nr:hypothetical protein [Myxococcales bacterium]
MRWTWMMVMGLGLALVPSSARAIQVMCSNDAGAACTVNNDPSATVDCTCDDAPAGTTTGSSENPWADYTEAELLEVCNDNLPVDCSFLETSGGGDEGTGGTGAASETTPDSDTNVTTDPTAAGSDSSDTGDDDEDGDKGCNVAGASPAATALLVLPLLWRRRRG